MTHKVLDKIDDKVRAKRAKGELRRWVEKGRAARYCRMLAKKHGAHSSALNLYLFGLIGQARPDGREGPDAQRADAS